MSAIGKMWLWTILLPLFAFLGQSMCVWPGPRFLGNLASLLLWLSMFVFFLVLAAVPATVWHAVAGVIYRKKDGEFKRRISNSLASLCFLGLSILAIRSAGSLRHQAFVQASHVGDRVVQALDQYRNANGGYPESLDQILPEYLEQLPYTGMIAYPEFTYRKDYHDIQKCPGEYELRINCPTGGIDFDRFIYWPSERYPDRIQGNRVELIRAWAYVHE